MNSQVFLRRLDLECCFRWARRWRVFERLSTCERGLFLSAILNRGKPWFQNADLVRQLRLIKAKLEQWIVTAKMLSMFTRQTQKRRWRDAKPLADIIEKIGCVPGNYALGAAGLHGESLTVYRLLKHGGVQGSPVGRLASAMYHGFM